MFEAHGDLSELDGYQVVPAKFAIYPSKDSEFHSKSRRSCFNLLTRLLQNENNGAVLSKENIIANLLKYIKGAYINFSLNLSLVTLSLLIVSKTAMIQKAFPALIPTYIKL